MGRRRVENIDDDVESVNQWEERQQKASMPQPDPSPKSDPGASAGGKVFVGTVEQFYSKLNVAAIKLEGSLKVGDVIEIGDAEDAIRQKITSMQINREDVSQAGEGDDIGIKVKHPVSIGSGVYKME